MAISKDKFLDYFNLALVNLSHRKTRTALTLVGIFIGIAAVVALISIGQGLQGAINSEFAKIGADKLLVMPGQGAGFSAGFSSAKLYGEDADVFRSVGGVSKVSPVIAKSVTVTSGSKTKSAFVRAIPVDENRKPAEEFYSIEVIGGSLLPRGGGFKALAGASAADGSLFGKKVKVGDTIVIQGQEFKIVGTLKKVGDPFLDGGFVIPLESAKEVFKESNYYALIGKLDPGIKPKDLVEKVKKALRRHRHVKEDEEDFAVQTSEQVIESFNNIFGIVQAIVIGIAAISLLVGGIGIMNTMYTSVLERTKEIGIMKAIGARNSDVMAIFLIESGLLGLVGGALGVLIGMAIGKLVEIGAEKALGTNLLVANFAPELIFGSLIFSFVIGSLSGVLPAKQAAELKPIAALRYE